MHVGVAMIMLVLGILNLLYLLLRHITESSQISSLQGLSQADVWVCYISCDYLFLVTSMKDVLGCNTVNDPVQMT